MKKEVFSMQAFLYALSSEQLSPPFFSIGHSLGLTTVAHLCPQKIHSGRCHGIHGDPLHPRKGWIRKPTRTSLPTLPAHPHSTFFIAAPWKPRATNFRTTFPRLSPSPETSKLPKTGEKSRADLWWLTFFLNLVFHNPILSSNLLFTIKSK